MEMAIQKTFKIQKLLLTGIIPSSGAENGSWDGVGIGYLCICTWSISVSEAKGVLMCLAPSFVDKNVKYLQGCELCCFDSLVNFLSNRYPLEESLSCKKGESRRTAASLRWLMNQFLEPLSQP